MNERDTMIFDYIVENGIATSSELVLVREIMSGSNEEVFNAVIYARTGYHTYEQLTME